MVTSPFPFKRFAQLIDFFSRLHPECGEQELLADRVFVEHVRDVESLWNTLVYRLPVLLTKQSLTSHPIRLLCIDSIGALFRGDMNNSNDRIKRSNTIVRLSMELHRLNVNSNLAIVVLNQVTEKFQPPIVVSRAKEEEEVDKSIPKVIDHLSCSSFPENSFDVYSQLDPQGLLSCVPCLGLTWANSLTTRLSLYRDPRKSIRKAYVVFSPFMCRKISEFSIDIQGVHMRSPDSFSS